jgi:DNA-binding MarR family transcriptional regulator
MSTRTRTLSLSTELRGATLRLARRLRQQKADDELSDAQFNVLTFLSRQGATTPNELSAWEHVTPPSMNRTLNALEAEGYVTRTPVETDGRKVLVTITADGEAIVAETGRKRDAWLDKRLAELSAEQRRVLVEATAIIRGMVQN